MVRGQPDMWAVHAAPATGAPSVDHTRPWRLRHRADGPRLDADRGRWPTDGAAAAYPAGARRAGAE
jgi:hypothetical protein